MMSCMSFLSLSLGSGRSSNVGIIIGVTVGGAVLLLLIVLAGIYALRQKKKAKRAIEISNPFGKIIRRLQEETRTDLTIHAVDTTLSLIKLILLSYCSSYLGP